MLVTRRHLFAVAGATAAFIVIERGTKAVVAAAGRAVIAMRPAPSGTSADRCALCGSPDHAMLDPRCPRSRPTRPMA